MVDLDRLKRDGYIVIKNAIKNPEIKLKYIKKDTRVHSTSMWNIRLSLKKYFKHFREVFKKLSKLDNKKLKKLIIGRVSFSPFSRLN